MLLREVDTGDLQDVHRVFASNPDFLALREEMAPYDLESVTRYWEVATLDPGRCWLRPSRSATCSPGRG